MRPLSLLGNRATSGELLLPLIRIPPAWLSPVVVVVVIVVVIIVVVVVVVVVVKSFVPPLTSQ